MSLIQYEGIVEVYLNGRLLTDAASARIGIKTNDNPVKTSVRGFAGFSNGAEDCEGTIEMPPPRDGFSVDWYTVRLRRQTVRMAWIDGGKRRQAEGRITSYDGSRSTEQTASVTLTFTGRPLGASL